MPDWYRAKQQFSADLADGSQQTVSIGQVLPGGHELVQRDLEAAAEGRDPLFELLPSDEPKQEKTAAKPRSAKAGA